MRVSRIEARRVFTRYGWQPISLDAFSVSAGKAVVTLENEDYKMRIFESGAQKKLRRYALVTDRKCNERYYLSATMRILRYAEKQDDLKLN